MFPIRTSEEFREVAARIALPAEEFVPERAPPESHWRLRHLPSAQELNGQTQRLIKIYKEDYHRIILDHYEEKGLSLSWRSPEKWTFACNPFYVNANQVVVMIVVRNPQITHHHDPVPRTSEAVKTPTPTASIKVPDQNLIGKINEKRQVAILKSRDPPDLDPFDLEVGDILALEGTEGLLVRAGGVTGIFIPYEIKRQMEGVQEHEAIMAEAAAKS